MLYEVITRVAVVLLFVCIIAAGAGAYYAYGIYENDLRQADLRIGDLERRLALVGDTAEDSLVNIQETLDFHFSEIDKLWAARNVLRQQSTDVQGEIAKLALRITSYNVCYTKLLRKGY